MYSKYDEQKTKNKSWRGGVRYARSRSTNDDIQDASGLITLSFYIPRIITRLLFKRVLLFQNKRSRMSNYRGHAAFPDSRGSWKVLRLRTP